MIATMINISFTLPLLAQPVAYRLYLQKDAKQLELAKRNFIESKIQELAAKLQISKPIELIEIKDLRISAQALGNNFFSGRAAVAIDPNFAMNSSEAALEFVIAHELAHIKNNDAIRFGVCSLAGIITTAAICLLFPASATQFSNPLLRLVLYSPAFVVGLTVIAVTYPLFSQWIEKRADLLAVSFCSEAAQKAAIEQFEKDRQAYIEIKNSPKSSLWQKLLITPDGECRDDLFHPPIKTRINYLQLKQGG